MHAAGSLRLASRTLALGAMVALGGCVANDVSLSITRFIPPMSTAGSSNAQCVFDPGSTANQLRGIYDMAIARITRAPYDINFVVSNNLMMVSTAPIDTQSYYINSFDVVLEPEGAVEAAIPPTRREFSFKSASIRLGPGGDAAAFVEAIPPDLIDAIANVAVEPMGLVQVNVRAVVTRAEEEHRTAYASFPVQICKGCLLGPNFVNGAIAACPVAGASLSGNPCNVAADQNVDCCTPDSGKSLTCGTAAAPPAMP